MSDGGFGGARVVVFESRRAPEMASLVARHGGLAVVAPTMREIPIGPTPALTSFAADLQAGAFDAVLFLTGVGARALFEAAAPVVDQATLLAALGRTRVVVRGPKPATFLRQLGFSTFEPQSGLRPSPGPAPLPPSPALVPRAGDWGMRFAAAPAPNTWREAAETLLAALADRPGGVRGARIALQEYGAPHDELVAMLAEAGVSTDRVPVYRWALPEDTAPLRSALAAIARREVRVVLFTSAQQITHALAVAREEGLADDVMAALRAGVVASIGPICTEALIDAGLPPDVEPEHSKMGHLVKATSEKASGVLLAKDAASTS